MRVTINWNEKFANLPEFELHLPCSIEPDFRYQWFNEEAYYYGENDAFVSFYSYPGPGQGYSGITVPITLLDGTRKALKGPYSGNVTIVNGSHLWRRYPGAKQPVVSIVSVESRFRKVNRHCTLEYIKQFCPPGVFIVCLAELLDGPVVYPNWQELNHGVGFQLVPSISPEEVKKPDVQ